MDKYIEKQAAIKAVCDSCGVMPDGEKDTCPYKYERAGCREYDKIIDISPADVRPVVHGRWVKVVGFFTPGGDPLWQCSECGKGRHVYGIEHGSYGADVSDGQWLACPNCMAIMEGESDG